MPDRKDPVTPSGLKLYAGPKIDAHSHVGYFGSWADISCTEEEIVAQMDANNVEKSCVYFLDNEKVKSAVGKYPKRLVGYVWPNPHDEKARETVRKALSEWGFKGVKLHPLFQAFLPNDEIVYPIMEEARRARLPVLIHSGHPPFSLPWSIGELAENFRDVTIVMLHMGHGHGVYIQAAINTAKRFDNIYLETSGMPMHTKIKEAMEKVGEERVMYGSDIPFQVPAVEIAKCTASGLSEKMLERLFYVNAKEALGV